MEFYEKTLSSKEIFSGKIVNLRVDKVQLPNGKVSTREIIQHPGAVAIVALTQEGDVLMVKQYRKAPESALLEIPAGKLEENEAKEDCAQRELMEETGYYANDIEYVTSFYTSPGFTNELIHLFFAKNIMPRKMQGDEDEYIELKYIPLKNAISKIYEGEIKDSKTITGLLLCYLKHKGVICK